MSKLQRVLMAAVLPPEAQMAQMISGMVVARCVTLAADLDLADRLKDGPKDVATLAAETGAQEDALYRVLRSLSGQGVFTELPGRQFKNSPLSEVLRSDAEGGIRDLARWLGHPMHWRSVGDLDHAVKTGKPSVTKSQPDRNPFDVMSDDPGATAVFNQAMAGHTRTSGAAIVKAYDFKPYRRVVDVGGGQGLFALMIAKAAPETRVTVYDLPHVVEGARAPIEAAGMKDRIEIAGGSFFDSVPGPADLCLLKFILHLCDDEAARKVLANCRAALDPKGRLLVCEMMISKGPMGVPARIMDMEMLIGTGGRERTEEEFSRLFASAGLKLLRLVRIRPPLRLLEVGLA